MYNLAAARLYHGPPGTIADRAETRGVFHINAYGLSLSPLYPYVEYRSIHDDLLDWQAAKGGAWHVATSGKEHHQAAN